MNKLFVLISTFILSCSEFNDTNINQMINKNDSLQKIDFQYIKTCGKKGITSVDMDSVSQKGNYLSHDFVKTHLSIVPVNNKDWHIFSSDYERVSCYQWEENENKFYFTIIQKDESCCLSMYLCVANIITGQILSVNFLGLKGADGGWFQKDVIKKIDYGKFKVVSNSFYDEDILEKNNYVNYKRTYTTIETMINANDNITIFDTLNIFTADTIFNTNE